MLFQVNNQQTFNKRKDGVFLKIKLYRLICLICVFTITVSLGIYPINAQDTNTGKMASVYGYALNTCMFNNGVISTIQRGASIPIDDDKYPNGVIYADTVCFDNNSEPCLIIVRADGKKQEVCTDIYEYEHQTESAVHVATLQKKYNTDKGVTGQFSLGWNDTNRYIVYSEYTNGVKSNGEYYTVIDGTAFEYVNPPSYIQTSGIVTYNSEFLRPDVDVSLYNTGLNEFFSLLKNNAANSVTYDDITERITEKEETQLESVLSEAARFISLDIGNFATLSEYESTLLKPTSDSKFYLITNLYDIGDEFYYVRFATDKSFYNFAVLRRTDSTKKGYQLLMVRTDSIPLTDSELNNIKEVYERNKLVAKKAKKSIALVNEPIFKFNKLQFEKTIKLPKLISSEYRVPIAVTGGGICLALLIILWVCIASDEE